MDITVYSHYPGMCKDGGQVFKPTPDSSVRDTIERVLADLSHKQDIRIIAVAVSKNGEVRLFNIRIRPHDTLDAQYVFFFAKDFCLVEAKVFSLKGVMHELEVLFADLSLHDFNSIEETNLFS